MPSKIAISFDFASSCLRAILIVDLHDFIDKVKIRSFVVRRLAKADINVIMQSLN